jgi:hypothetical protein
MLPIQPPFLCIAQRPVVGRGRSGHDSEKIACLIVRRVFQTMTMHTPMYRSVVHLVYGFRVWVGSAMHIQQASKFSRPCRHVPYDAHAHPLRYLLLSSLTHQRKHNVTAAIPITYFHQ